MTRERQIELLTNAHERMKRSAEEHIRSEPFQAILRKYDDKFSALQASKRILSERTS